MTSTVTPGVRYIIPVISSTATVAFCFSEYWTLLPFRRSDIPPESLSSFWDSYLYNTMPGWLAYGLTSSVSGYLCFRNTAGWTKTWYGWGTIFALGHYAFGQRVANVIKDIVHGPPAKTKGLLNEWLLIHTVRTLLLDIPAMACFFAALVHML